MRVHWIWLVAAAAAGYFLASTDAVNQVVASVRQGVSTAPAMGPVVGHAPVP